MSSPSLEAQAGQLIVGGIHGHEPSTAVRRQLAAGELGGVILFARNVANPQQVARLNEAVHRHAPADLPPFVAVDQEGGRVARLVDGVTPLPPMRRVGERGDVALAGAVGQVMAHELQALGFNLNFAPVLDLDTNPANPVIGDRAFGADPEGVAALAEALFGAHLGGGVIPCGKHFPGHGDTATDSHHALPVIEHPLELLERRELIPFARAVAAGIPMIMTAHIVLRAIDPEHPATLSPPVLAILREQLGFAGVIVSDDLEMAAVAEHYPIDEIVRRGLEAGVDLFLVCYSADLQQAARETLIRAAQSSSAMRARLEQSYHRVVGLKRSLLPAGPWRSDPAALRRLGCAAHRQVIANLG